jgi:hypothetical protein
MSKETDTALVLVAIGVGGYLLYQLIKGGTSAVSAATDAAGNSVANAVESVFGTGLATSGQTYQVTMPDGTVQTVPYGQLPNPAGAGITDTGSELTADAYGNDF